MLPSKQGYRQVKEILHNNFGETLAIVQAFIEKVTVRPKSVHGNLKGCLNWLTT